MTAVRFLHGGVPGLAPGDLVLPPSTTGAECHTAARVATRDYSPRRVYVTEGLAYAQFFAHVRDGAVYLVRPIGPVRLDEDSDVARSWSCRRAEVLSVLIPAPAPLPPEVGPAQRALVAQFRAAVRQEHARA